jgi:hypothetical protein
MEMSDQLQAPEVLLPRWFPGTLGQEALWASEPVENLWIREILYPHRESNPGRPECRQPLNHLDKIRQNFVTDFADMKRIWGREGYINYHQELEYKPEEQGTLKLMRYSSTKTRGSRRRKDHTICRLLNTNYLHHRLQIFSEIVISAVCVIDKFISMS